MLLVVSILPNGQVNCNSADRAKTALAYQVMRDDLFASATAIALSIENGTSIATIGALVDRYMPALEQIGFDGVAVLRCSTVTAQPMHTGTLIACAEVFLHRDDKG